MSLLSSKTTTLGIISSLSLSVSAIALNADNMTPSLNAYGTTGLIDMPSAESQPDAEFSTTLGGFAGATRGTFTFQILPRLSGGFRYAKTGFTDGDGSQYDRSFDLQYRLVDEGEYIPSVAVGLRDFMGTGIYSGQYFVATKKLTSTLKVTGGLGWGRFSDSNQVQTIDAIEGGEPDLKQLFSGPMGFFGGLEWQTPVKGLHAKIEYSADRYVSENTISVNNTSAAFDRKSPINVGLEYQMRNGFKLGAFIMHGSEIGFSFSTSLNPKRNVGVVDRAPRRVSVRTGVIDRSTDWMQTEGINDKARQQLNKLLKTDGMTVEVVSFDGATAEVRVRNSKYKAVPQAIGRVARAMTRVLPDSIETFRVIPVDRGVPSVAITMQRRDIEELENHPDQSVLMAQRADISDAEPAPAGTNRPSDLYPKLKWSLAPFANITLFDSQNPLDADIGLRFAASYDIAPGLSVSGSVKKNLVDKSVSDNVQSPTVLYRVRTDSNKYREQGDPALERLTADYVFKLRPDVYGRVSVGYLETMFGGISTELLWKQADKNWGLGAEINHVKQREFSQGFGFQDYTTTTGFVSAYFGLPKGFEGQVNVGRYLAGDVGATFRVDRTFGNGWRVGAYATLTDVSAEDFGDGSFDKGIQLDIPLSWALGTPSKKVVSNKLATQARDGGARLNIENRLYGTIRDTHGTALSSAWGRFWR